MSVGKIPATAAGLGYDSVPRCITILPLGWKQNMWNAYLVFFMQGSPLDNDSYSERTVKSIMIRTTAAPGSRNSEADPMTRW